MLGYFTRMRKANAANVCEDGFGQSLVDDARFVVRFNKVKRCSINWRAPTQDERRAHATHVVVSRFGDSTVAVADWEGRHCLVRERTWFGWPDAAQFAFFAVSLNGSIWAARDFSFWPQSWTRPTAQHTIEWK